MLAIALLLVLLLCKYVLAIETVPAVLVNQMILRTQRQGDVEYALYHYGDGDEVDVSCVSLYTYNVCYIQFNYDYVEALDDVFRSHNLGSYQGVGFRTKLKTIHNNSQLTCKCAGSHRQSITTFLLKNNFDDIIKIKINGLTLREVTNHNKDIDVIDIRIQKDERIGNEDTNVQLTTVVDDVDLNWYPPSHNPLNILKNDNRKIHFTMCPGRLTLTVTLANNSTKFLIRTLKLDFTPLPFTSTEYRQLVRDLPKENALLELYNYVGIQNIYYEYEEDDIIDIKCVTSPLFESRLKLSGLGHVNDYSLTNITKTLHLSSKENNEVLECISENSSSTVARAFINLRYKSPVLRILVNGLRLTTRRDPDENINRSVVYHFEAGDVVDPSCIKLADDCTTMLTFIHADSSRLDDVFKSTDLSSPYAIGFHTNLYDSDDKSQMVCKCICPNNTTTFKLTFALRNKYDDFVHNAVKLAINNRTVREMIPQLGTQTEVAHFIPLTYYTDYDTVKIEAHTKTFNTMLSWTFKGPPQVVKKHSKNHENSTVLIELAMKRTYNTSIDVFIYVWEKQSKMLVFFKISLIILSRHSIMTLVNADKGEDKTSYWLYGILSGAAVFIVSTICIIWYIRRRKPSEGTTEYSATNEFEKIVLKPGPSSNLPSAPPYESSSRSGSRKKDSGKNASPRTNCQQIEENEYEYIDIGCPIPKPRAQNKILPKST